jgi:predicted nucleic acid-binding protein
MPVADSSPLIYLGKVGKLYLLRDLYGSVKIPTAVYDEVVIKGKDKGFEDALRVEAEVGKFIFVHKPKMVNEVKERLRKLNLRLGLGEVECIALCLDTDDKILLSDDDDAKRFAMSYGIDGKGTIYILLKSYREGILNKKDCIETFESIVKSGFWLNPEVISIFYRTLDRLQGPE